MKFSLLSFILLVSATLRAQDLHLEQIMQGPEFTGDAPEDFYWSRDGKSIYFNWNPDHEPGPSLWRYVPGTKASEKSKELHPNFYFPENQSVFFIADDGLRMTGEQGNSLLIYPGKISDFQPFGKQVFFRDGMTCYTYSAGTGLTVAAVFQESTDDESATALEKQQLKLFSVIRKDSLAEAWEEQHRLNRVPHISVPPHHKVIHASMTDDGNAIVFRCDFQSTQQMTKMPQYVTASGEVETQDARPKVTSHETSGKLGIFNLQTQALSWLQCELLSGIHERPGYFADYAIAGNYAIPKPVVFHKPVAGTSGLMLVDIRSSDNKDRWIILLNTQTATFREISHQHDEAWIGGPGISEWNEARSVLGWVDNQNCYYQSEQSGFSHLYVFDTEKWKERQLTSGTFEVHDVVPSRDKKRFYLVLNKLHPGVRNGYVLDIASGSLKPVFEGNFGMEWKLSPDEKMWVIKKSEALHPERLFYAENKPGAVLHPVQNTETPAYSDLNLPEPAIVSFPADDGETIYARVYKPSTPNGAAVFFVHGAGYLQNAHYYWSYYQREMLFHQLLAQEGYTVMDLDYRGSEGYGRDFRTAIYRDMGDRELEDYLDAKDYLVARYGIDSSRVGIYGGSYGGFLTLMALFKTDHFACGAALRSVTDWAHYNQEYTSNILNYPETDSIAYRRSSPIFYAEGLNEPLLMLHGVEDDNVHFQDIVRLNQRLIELRKKNYWLAIYPVESHGFINTDSWIDEYSRICDLFHNCLK